jgi:hypothetical protein
MQFGFGKFCDFAVMSFRATSTTGAVSKTLARHPQKETAPWIAPRGGFCFRAFGAEN